MAHNASQCDWERFKRGQIAESSFWSSQEAQSYRCALTFDPAMKALVHRLRERGIQTALATNFAPQWLDYLSSMEVVPMDVALVSGALGFAKPEQDFWIELRRHVPKGSVFVDDKRENLAAAAQYGLVPMLMTTPRDVATTLLAMFSEFESREPRSSARA